MTVGVLLIDACLLLDRSQEHAHGDAFLDAALLRRLQHSDLRVAICCPEGEVALIEEASKYSFEYIPCHGSSLGDSIDGLLQSSSGLACIYATSRSDESLLLKLLDRGWKVILKSSDEVCAEIAGLVTIRKLEELVFAIHRIVKMEFFHMSPVSVGYVMKPSRELDFAKRGAFPFHPTPNGLLFVPISFDLPLARQMQEINIVLHKATDEISSIFPAASSDSQQGVTYTSGMQQLQRYFQQHPDCCVIDPLYNINPLLDRLKIQELLLGLESLNKDAGNQVRGPRFLKVDTFHESNIKDRLSQAKLSFPNIVKPQVACGLADAHSMALVFKVEHYRNLIIPLPAVIQEYVDHGSILYKFYVLGERIFHAVKKSMPNADVLRLSSEQNGSAPIFFDSLKSLPTANIDIQVSKKYLDIKLAEKAATWLRKMLGLTIFGFDVVVQEGSGDHVIVDVNYLPSFKEIPDEEAIPAFWDAIRSSYESKKAKCMAE